MTFLAHMVREEGGYEYKKAIVDAFLSLIRKIDGAKDAGLLHLAEFIEDCEFTYLSTQVRLPPTLFHPRCHPSRTRVVLMLQVLQVKYHSGDVGQGMLVIIRPGQLYPSGK